MTSIIRLSCLMQDLRDEDKGNDPAIPRRCASLFAEISPGQSAGFEDSVGRWMLDRTIGTNKKGHPETNITFGEHGATLLKLIQETYSAKDQFSARDTVHTYVYLSPIGKILGRFIQGTSDTNRNFFEYITIYGAEFEDGCKQRLRKQGSPPSAYSAGLEMTDFSSVLHKVFLNTILMLRSAGISFEKGLLWNPALQCCSTNGPPHPTSGSLLKAYTTKSRAHLSSVPVKSSNKFSQSGHTSGPPHYLCESESENESDVPDTQIPSPEDYPELEELDQVAKQQGWDISALKWLDIVCLHQTAPMSLAKKRCPSSVDEPFRKYIEHTEFRHIETYQKHADNPN
ncbi:hypothetical protein BCR34DRAFT_594373 [Clohesyomyces aquaticus]|uniref:Uncharacterized protein n=1 Tax=Clohesyomyces aquaticus TaxID=1231657 RepID=A0A1Y1Y9H2_9PLEO|nr:hypothetical protein BCR34DRAFT_594373 [Clohesyomyces aquaticus]